MNRELKVTTGGALTFSWPLTIEQMYELNDYCVERLGVPVVTRDDSPVDLAPYIERRMGEVGVPRREYIIEPAEEPISTPVPEREPASPTPTQEPVPA